jgi:hypothetical protein
MHISLHIHSISYPPLAHSRYHDSYSLIYYIILKTVQIKLFVKPHALYKSRVYDILE